MRSCSGGDHGNANGRSPVMTRDEVIAKIRVVRHRLEGALNRFYSHDLSGDHVAIEAEALDISMPIRVMIHHNPRHGTVALLNELDNLYMDKPIHFRPLIASPPMTLPSGVQTMTVAIPINMTLGARRAAFTRYKGEPAPRVQLRNWAGGPSLRFVQGWGF
jgi:hypothetical protein